MCLLPLRVPPPPGGGGGTEARTDAGGVSGLTKALNGEALSATGPTGASCAETPVGNGGWPSAGAGAGSPRHRRRAPDTDDRGGELAELMSFSRSLTTKALSSAAAPPPQLSQHPAPQPKPGRAPPTAQCPMERSMTMERSVLGRSTTARLADMARRVAGGGADGAHNRGVGGSVRRLLAPSTEERAALESRCEQYDAQKCPKPAPQQLPDVKEELLTRRRRREEQSRRGSAARRRVADVQRTVAAELQRVEREQARREEAALVRAEQMRAAHGVSGEFVLARGQTNRCLLTDADRQCAWLALSASAAAALELRRRSGVALRCLIARRAGTLWRQGARQEHHARSRSIAQVSYLLRRRRDAVQFKVAVSSLLVKMRRIQRWWRWESLCQRNSVVSTFVSALKSIRDAKQVARRRQPPKLVISGFTGAGSPRARPRGRTRGNRTPMNRSPRARGETMLGVVTPSGRSPRNTPRPCGSPRSPGSRCLQSIMIPPAASPRSAAAGQAANGFLAVAQAMTRPGGHFGAASAAARSAGEQVAGGAGSPRATRKRSQAFIVAHEMVIDVAQ